MKSFYEIALENEQLEAALEEAGGEINLTLEERIKIVGDLIVSKVDGCVSFIEMKESEVEYAKKKLKELKDFIQYRENEINRFYDYTIACMTKMGVEKLDGEHGTISIRKNPPAVRIFDEQALPPAYKTIVQEIKIDKNAIKEELKKGGVVSGAELTYGSSIKFGLKKKL